MADLKANSTVGGAPIWHKGNFPLYPIGDILNYKTYKVYTEHDKPQAVDNDFVSKASGGVYKGAVSFDKGLKFKDKDGAELVLGVPNNNGPMATYKASLKVTGQFALETADGTPFVIFDPIVAADKYRLIVMGDVLGEEVHDASGRVFSPAHPPSKEQVGLSLVDNYKQVRLEYEPTQTMTGELRSPSFSVIVPATRDDQVPRFDQIVIKNSVQDFGYYS